MKKFLLGLILAICVVMFSLPAFAQRRSPQTLSRIRDSLNQALMANVRTLQLTLTNNLEGVGAFAVQYYYDGTQLRMRVGAEINSDDVTAPYAPWAGTLLHAWDGSAWDMLRVGAGTGLLTDRTWTIAGEDDASDWTKVKKEEIGTYTPDPQTEATIAGTAVTCLDSLDAITYPNWCVYVKNTDGANPFTDVDVESSPDNSNWVDLGWTTCDALAAGSTCVYCASGSAYRFIRVRITAHAVNTASSSVWFTGNKD